MAKVRRVGFGTVFHLDNEKVGIGTTGRFFTEVRVLKNIESSDANAVTQAQLENYQGFLSNETRLSGNDVDLNKLVGYVRGEAYYGESHAHTQDDGTVVNMVGSAHTTFSHNVIDDSSNIQSGAMGDIIIDGEFTVSSGTTYCSSVEQLTCVANFTVPTGNTDDRIHCHTAGSMRFNEDLGTLEFYTGDEWKTVNSFKDTGNRGRGVFGGGWTGDNVALSTISFVNIMALGNAQEFGDLVGNARSGAASASSSTRGLFMGGGSPTRRNDIDYITIASEGDGIDFGNITESVGFMGGASSSTRGLRMGGTTPSKVNTIDYVEIATLGDALDFGDLTEAPSASGCLSSPTRGFRIGGSTPTFTSTIDVVSIASKGNAIKFGDMTTLKDNCRGNVQSQTRGIIAAGRPSPGSGFSFVEFITMASEGNSTMFGDLTRAHSGPAGTSNQVRGIFYGGGNSTPYTNVIDFITIATTGDAQDFGDATQTTNNAAGLSDSHGGLGGF